MREPWVGGARDVDGQGGRVIVCRSANQLASRSARFTVSRTTQPREGVRMARPQAPRGQGRGRVLAAALDLFAEHGVSGTSLQMIADRLGVTKAAVYHQFATKDEIVLAVVEPALDRLAQICDTAEAERGQAARRDAALAGVVDVVVTYRRV